MVQFVRTLSFFILLLGVSSCALVDVSFSRLQLSPGPKGLVASPGNGKATISWQPLSGATSYNLYWSTSYPVTSSDNVIKNVSSPYTHSGLTNGVTYYYAISAVVSGSATSLSSTVGTKAASFVNFPIDSQTSIPGNIGITGIYAESAALYVSTPIGLLISQDQGSTFHAVTATQGLSQSPGPAVCAGQSLFAAGSVTLSASVDAGWTFSVKASTTQITGSGLNTISSIACDTQMIAVGTTGGLYLSTDGAASWTLAAPTSGDWIVDVALSGSSIYAAGKGIYVSSDSGVTWTHYTTTNGLPTTYMSGVAPFGSDIAATSSQGVSIFNGSAWNTYTTADGLGNNNVSAITASASTLYAATDGGLSISKDGGLTWTNHSLGALPITSVAVSGSDIYAASSQGGGLYHSSDDGASWTHISASTNVTPYGLTGVYVSGNTLYATGGDVLYVSHDGGSTWTQSSSPSGNTLETLQVVGSTIYVADRIQGVFTSTNEGATWTNINGSDAQDLLVSGSNIYLAAVGVGLVTSTNSGSTWTVKSLPLNPWIFKLFVVGSTIYAATQFGSGLYVTSNGGTTWTSYGTAQGLASNYMYTVAVSGSDIYVGSLSALSISRNGGTTWTNYTSANGLGSSGVSSLLIDGSTVYAGTGGGLSVSTDGGTTWSNTSFGLNGVSGIFVLNGKVYAATELGLFATAP